MHFIDLATANGLPLDHSVDEQGTFPECLANNTFRVSDTHNYYCEQSKWRPDAVQYLRDFHSRSFKEACRQLGMELNIAPHATLPSQLASYDSIAADIFGNEWQEQALRFVMDCHYRLMATPAALGLLYDRGFTNGTMQQFYLGWHEALPGEQKRPWPPVGLVIPTIDLGFERLVKIRVQLRVQPVDAQEVFVSVSGPIRSAGVYGDAAGKPVVVLERELDAMLVQQCAGDVCCPVALGGCLFPDEEFDRLLRDSCGVLYAVGNKSVFRWWRERYPGIMEWEMPRVGDGFGVGLRLRRWVLDGVRCVG